MENSILLFIGGFGRPEFLFILLFLLAPAVLWLWALVDLLRSDFADKTNKLIWAMVVIFVPILGALLYLLIGKNQKLKPQGR